MAQNEVTFVIDSDGRTLFLMAECMEGSSLLEYAKIARASHVEPGSRDLRFWFHLLRKVFGEYGRIGNWTRTWKCLWRVRLTNGYILKMKDVKSRTEFVCPVLCDDWIAYWSDRAEAIAVEIEYLNQKFIGDKND